LTSSKILRAAQVATSAAMIGLGIQAAYAQVEPDLPDTLTVYGSSMTNYDSNLFRLADTVDTRAALDESKRDSLVQTATIGLQLDKQYSQQEFVGNASYSYSWYQTFSYLDASATNFDLAWKFHLSPWIEGTLSGNRREVPADYDFYRDLHEQNSYIQQQYRLRFDANPWSGWHLIGGGGAYLSSNTSSSSDQPKYEQYFLDGGLGYATLAGSRLQSIGRYAEGSYAQSNSSVFANARDFSEKSVEFQFLSSSASDLTLKLVGGYLSRTHEQLSKRNYDGLTADSLLSWQATDKLSLSGGFKRILSAYQDSYFTNYSREDYTIAPRWDFTPKISLGGTYGYSRYKFGGYSSLTSTSSKETRTDQVGIYSIDARWVPARFLDIKASMSNRVRDSSFGLDNLDYTTNLMSIVLTISY
jgi:exopolysaccharide biosynthesis operon protein EpsL